jgi:enolase
MSKIKSVRAREILDSRGNPTVEVDLELSDGSFGRASVPSGASTGSHEAVELRDGGTRYGGKGVLKAVGNVNAAISKAVAGKEFVQRTIDQAMAGLDGTADKRNLGANAILGVSMAFAKAAAAETGKPFYMYFNSLMPDNASPCLPVPMMNVMNGGKHAAYSADIQEFMIVPHGFPTFSEALRAGTETFQALRKILDSKGLSTLVGDEGGFAPPLPSNEAPIELILEAVKGAGYEAGKDISLALDVAATELYRDGKYVLDKDGKSFDAKGLIAWYEGLIEKYPIISIEDGLAEDDWDSWVELTKSLGQKISLIGDDLFVTNIGRLQQGIDKSVANSILIKLNQIGTVSETIDCMALAARSGYASVVSHRSGETEDPLIADFAVGTGAGRIKTGSLSRSERTAKYNQLLRIEEGSSGKLPFFPSFRAKRKSPLGDFSFCDS